MCLKSQDKCDKGISMLLPIERDVTKRLIYLAGILLCLSIDGVLAEDKDVIFFKDQNLSVPFEDRQVTNAGDKIMVYVDSCKVKLVKFEETERETRIMAREFYRKYDDYEVLEMK